jgi:hypothetical protein
MARFESDWNAAEACVFAGAGIVSGCAAWGRAIPDVAPMSTTASNTIHGRESGKQVRIFPNAAMRIQ